jgi:RNA polymerase sigma-70 factor (ECF subfamily)
LAIVTRKNFGFAPVIQRMGGMRIGGIILEKGPSIAASCHVFCESTTKLMTSNEQENLHDRFVRTLSRHSRQIFGFILTLASERSDAEDIFQDTSVKLWKKFSTFEEGTNFRAWAYQVAYLEVLEYRRKKGRQQLLCEEAFQILARDALLRTVEDTSRREEALAKCIEKLAKTDRKLVERRYFAAQSPKQIAEQTARSIHVVYRSLARIHDALMRCVQQALSGENVS